MHLRTSKDWGFQLVSCKGSQTATNVEYCTVIARGISILWSLLPAVDTAKLALKKLAWVSVAVQPHQRISKDNGKQETQWKKHCRLFFKQLSFILGARNFI